MVDKNTLYRLQGRVQNYQWGGYKYLPELLGIDNHESRPFAEYWLGAHPNAPSMLENGESLYQVIANHPDWLGEAAQRRFRSLPYLLKVLDVKDMLSIQVHPSKEAAAREFAAENKKGISVHAPERNYKDENHKPELMAALSEFWLLHGFKNAKLVKQTINAIPEFSFMLPFFEKGGYKALYEHLMQMSQEAVDRVLRPLLERVLPLYEAGKLDRSDPAFWAARAALIFNKGAHIDRGIFSIYLFNIVHLSPGEAIFQDAGILHAYLEGQNVEIMANSDNVLRGGLTPKHIDLPELMKHVIFEPVQPRVIKAQKTTSLERVFSTPAPDFELSVMDMKAGEEQTLHVHSVDIFLVLQGVVEIEGLGILQKGGSFVAFEGSHPRLRASIAAEIYRATVPERRNM